jgi:hypothetical protein
MGRTSAATLVALILALLLLTPTQGNDSSVPCLATEECEDLVGVGWECLEGVCSDGNNPNLPAANPFEQGCLYQMLPGWNKKRVCNSDDPPGAAESGYCRKPDIDHMEIRIFSQNWESAFFEAWILQMVLSEMLDVPATIETGTPDARISFYDPQASFQYGTSRDLLALQNAATQSGFDCRLASRDPDSYQSCAHVVTEFWNSDLVYTHDQDLVRSGILEPPEPLGALGQEGWFVPKFTALRDPSVLNYLGLQGEVNRRKLAETFLRPTTWGEYCDLVSPNRCAADDGVARRPPQDESEYERMFVDGLYTGHFRKTEQSDCDKYPTNCTGHIADFPCGWSSYVTPQTHHLNISLEGVMYSYSQLTELWRAANATKSNLMMMWWSPEVMYQSFQGTYAEFVRVSLPSPTQECIDSRLPWDDRCSDDFQRRVGSPLGVCDEPAAPLKKLILKGLYDATFDPSIPEAIRSPGYDAAHLFSVSELQLGEMFNYWSRMHTPREAICQWAVDNIRHMETMIPRTYPRVSEEEQIEDSMLYSSTLLGGFVLLLVFLTSWKIFRQRERRVMKCAQTEFLWLLLAGSFTISIGAIVEASSKPTRASCVAGIWLINLGYTLELVPLIVKIAAINRLTNAAKRMRRVVLRRSSLFGAVILISSLMALFLILWTTLDPPRGEAEYHLSNNVKQNGETVVTVHFYCSSKSDVWRFLAVGWNTLLLTSATVLAFQTRKLPGQQDLSESQTLATLIYSHFVFVVLRVVTFFLSLDESFLTQFRSMLYSFDTMATLLIYFVPKFMAKDRERNSSFQSSMNFQPPTLPRPISRWISNISAISQHATDATDQSHDAVLDVEASTDSLPTLRRYSC